jgi:hypothetical protein
MTTPRPSSPALALAVALLGAWAVACNGKTPDRRDLGDWRDGGDAAGGADYHLPQTDNTPSLWPPCGNNQINGLEACDRSAFRIGPDCAAYTNGLATGTASCRADCTVDLSACSIGPCSAWGWDQDTGCDACILLDGTHDSVCASVCGDDEACGDYHDLMVGDWTCAAEGFGWDPDCPVCGDDVRADGPDPYGEYCDGPDLGGAGCADWGFDTGTLGCRADCTFDFSNCRFRIAGSDCGDGAVTGFEPCERGLTDDCSAYGFGTGTIRCADDCQFDFSGCSEQDVCMAQGWYDDDHCDLCQYLGGDPDPDCDHCGADGLCAERFNAIVGVWGCASLGPPDPDCGVCGNNVREAVELCDGNDLAGQTCAGIPDDGGWGFSSGTLGCNYDCTLNFARCIP